MGESTQDSTGAWVEASTSSRVLSECREETNGKGVEIPIAGGEFRRFSSLILLPKNCPIVKEGTQVSVSNDREGKEIRIRGEVLKFDKGQLHNRLWL